MSKRPDLEFEVRWLPFQLNPDASQQPASKIQMYMKKFGKSKEEVMQMGGGMGQKFAAVGLPYNFTEKGLVSNTFDAHRVLTAAYQSGGAAAQDKAAESLFHSYFVEELAPNDPVALQAAGAAAGLDGKALVANPNLSAAETKEEISMGRQLRVTGVPHFVIRKDGGGKTEQLSGAQPPEDFIRAFKSVAQDGGGKAGTQWEQS